MRRFAFALIIVAIALLWGGGQAFYTGIKYSEPVTMTCQEYLDQRPENKWVNLQDCTIVAAEYVFREGRKITEVYVPVLPAGVDFYRDKPEIALVLFTDDKDIIDLVNEVEGLPENISEADAANFMSQNLDRLYPKGPVHGLVQFGIELKDSDRRQISGLYENVASNFAIIEHDKKPDMFMGLIMLVGGLALGGGMGFYLLRSGSESA
jgi:hypothetical protein